ncbi:hypothetical protein ACRFGY_24820, partial [Klebsiella pneumoniae]
MRDLILQLSKSSIYSTKPRKACVSPENPTRHGDTYPKPYLFNKEKPLLIIALLLLRVAFFINNAIP